MHPTCLLVSEPLTMVWTSTVVLLMLFFLLAVSLTMFYTLVWRETHNRAAAARAEWARNVHFRIVPTAKATPPVPLERMARNVRVRALLAGPKCLLVQFLVDRKAGTPDGSPAAIPPRRRFNALIWPIEFDWPAIGLRPSNASDSLVDLLSLPPQRAQGTERFTICTADRKTARVLAASSARGLLPPDIGMILLGRHLLLDFSDRPFDGIEFNRMIAVAEQVAAHLPQLG